MTKEERDFIRWMLESAQTEGELKRAYEATEYAYNRRTGRMSIREEKPVRKQNYC